MDLKDFVKQKDFNRSIYGQIDLGPLINVKPSKVPFLFWDTKFSPKYSKLIVVE